MIPDVGLFALTIAFGLAIYATLLSIYGRYKIAPPGWKAPGMQPWPYLAC